ncbi:zinc/manganese transport system ATP-binding protein [Rhizobiales bacterium GAS191]|nr:zinc/manganese transport system ATP-binding protein [Rhizobiales bacterium GAS188]SEE32687.1 zinc/manganese transport system ATP-binding protein [Rhizobiales bacterium GAS191]
MEALAFTDVTLELGGRSILSRVSFSIEDGEFIGLLGANGAGKTTLMRAALGLIPPAGGEIRVLSGSPARADALIGYMPQTRSASLGSRLSGWDFVACAADGQRFGLPILDKTLRFDVDRAIALVGAAELSRRPLAELSGGERQRLLLAQALLGKPRLLLLDEPLISLDLNHQQGIVKLVSELNRELKLTVLFSAHEINPLMGVIDRVLYLGNRQAALGTVEDVITSPVLSRLYGTEIDVVRLKGRVFVMAGAYEIERDEHRHDG